MTKETEVESSLPYTAKELQLDAELPLKEDMFPNIAESTIDSFLGKQQQESTTEELLLKKAVDLEIELSEVNLEDADEQAELFVCFEIQNNLSKKTKLRKLIREMQTKPVKTSNNEHETSTETTATAAASSSVTSPSPPDTIMLPTVSLCNAYEQIATHMTKAAEMNEGDEQIAALAKTMAKAVAITTADDKEGPKVGVEEQLDETASEAPFVDPIVTDVAQDQYMLVDIVKFLPVTEIIGMKAVASSWKSAGVVAIDARCHGKQEAFTTKEQLEKQISIYMDFRPGDVESMARTIGYPMNRWNVSQITNFTNLFAWRADFNEDVGDWNVENATTMENMFRSTVRFNRSLEKWNVAKVTNFSSMFEGAESFEGKGVENWAVFNAQDMSAMFQFCRSFDVDLRHWNVSNVTNMGAMFHGAAMFFGRGIENWVVEKVENMQMMFSGTEQFNADIRNWDISNVVNMIMMFQASQSFNRDLRHWKFHPDCNAGMMFSDAASFPREYTPRKEGDSLSEYHISYKDQFQTGW